MQGPKGDKGDPNPWREGFIMYTPPVEVFVGEQQPTFGESPYPSLEAAGSVAWQSFRPVNTGTLTRLDLAVSAYKDGSNEQRFCGTVAVLRGDSPSGTLLGELEISLGANDVANPRFLGFPVPGVTLTAGESYTWTVTHNGCAPLALGYGTGDAYSAGTSSLGTDADLAFRTFVSVTPESIPLKAALLTDAPVGIGTENPNPDAMLDVNGKIYQRGAQLHADYVFQAGYRLETINEHGELMWANRHLPAVPKATTDLGGNEILEVGQHQRGILEELEKAHIYIQLLHQRLGELEARFQQD